MHSSRILDLQTAWTEVSSGFRYVMFLKSGQCRDPEPGINFRAFYFNRSEYYLRCQLYIHTNRNRSAEPDSDAV